MCNYSNKLGEFTPKDIYVSHCKLISIFDKEIKENHTSESLFKALKTNNIHFQDSPLFILEILSQLTSNRLTNHLNYFIKNIDKNKFTACINGLSLPYYHHIFESKCPRTVPLPPLLFYAIFHKNLDKKFDLDPKLINALLAHEDIDVNSLLHRSQFNIDTSNDIYDLLMMDGGSPLDIVVEKIKNIPLAQALFLHGAKLKLSPSKSGLKFYDSITKPLYDSYKWLFLSKFDHLSHFKVFPKEILSLIAKYQIKTAKQKFLPEDNSFSGKASAYLLVLFELQGALWGNKYFFEENNEQIRRESLFNEVLIRDLNALFRQSAADPKLIDVLRLILKNAKVLDVDIHQSEEGSGSALDVAIKHDHQQAIELLKLYQVRS